MKVHIISLLALLISSKVNATDLDENLSKLPICWTTGKDGKSIPTDIADCIADYRACLQALEDDNSMGGHSLSYYTEGRNECAISYGKFYPVQDLKQACIKKWNEYCHEKKMGGIHRGHRRNECRRNLEAICTTIYGPH